MTLTASKNLTGSSPNAIRVTVTSGSVTVNVDEQSGHLRGFHDQLGRLLDEAEAESKSE